MIARAYFYCCTVEAHIMYTENNKIKSSTNISASTVYQDTDGKCTGTYEHSGAAGMTTAHFLHK